MESAGVGQGFMCQVLRLWSWEDNKEGVLASGKLAILWWLWWKRTREINRKLVLIAGPQETSGSCLFVMSKLRSQGIHGFQPCCAEGAQFVLRFVATQLCQTLAKFQHLLYPFSLPSVRFTLSPFWLTDFTTVLTIIVAKSDGGFIRMAINAAGDGRKVNAH